MKAERPSFKRTLAAVLLASTILSGGGGYLAARALAANDAALPAAPVEQLAVKPSFADLVEKVKPAVVNIATTEKATRQAQRLPQSPFPPGSPFEEFFRQFGEQQQRRSGSQHALGSGFIIDPAGYVVTNNHVVDGAEKIVVTLDDGREFPATVKGRDPKTDLALLKIEAKTPLPYVAFGDSDRARIGDWVVAVGNPFGLGGSVSAGIVSARGRNLNSGPYDNFLQIDAPINPGNSGGPLFDQSGRVIGIATAIYTPNGGNVGIGFAVPSNLAGSVIAQLKDSGMVARGWLGVTMQPMTEALAKAVGRKDDSGILVNDVQSDGPAAKAGLKQGDVVIALNGSTIRNPRDLATQVAGLKAGDKAKLDVWREGREKTLTITVGSQPTEQSAALDEAGKEERVGLALAPVTPELRTRLGLDDGKGAVVTEVTPESRAEDSGVRPGDVILGVAGHAVANPAEAAEQIRTARQQHKEAVTLLVRRDGTTYYLALQLA
ncbi:MAG: DegQ family serine endoprotease [Ferrovibrio sp.]|uniref:DegQ family serine endoprotease n=1 Tax=Ferrovibrio sp. TaxID=1917215 RepID=UPI003918D1D3